MYRVLRAMQIALQTRNSGQLLMKTTIKHENDEFFAYLSNMYRVLRAMQIALEPEKIWAIAHENGHKTRKLWVFGPNSQTCIGSLKPHKSPRNSENCGQ